MKVLRNILLVATVLGCSEQASRRPGSYLERADAGGFVPFDVTPPSATDGGAAPTDAGHVGTLSLRLGDTVARETAPPPISGGTLRALRDGRTFVAADSDRDRVWLVDLPTRAVRSVALRLGDEPGRVEEGDDGTVYVSLRRGGAVVTVDVARGQLTARRAVCVAPRGLAWDAPRGELLVACAGGEFAAIPREGEARVVRLDDDLRDVVIWRDRRFVSRFRSAELLEVDLEGRVLQRTSPPPRRDSFGGSARVPGVAWRTVAHPTLGVLMLHQSTSAARIDLGTPERGLRAQAYGGAAEGRTAGCADGMVSAVLTSFHGERSLAEGLLLPSAILAVDVAAQGDLFAVATPGSSFEGAQAVTFELPSTPRVSPCPSLRRHGVEAGRHQAVAVAADARGDVFAQFREPAGLMRMDDSRAFIPFPDAASALDTGHAVFHAGTPAGMACASCHPEGGDDGRVWRFLPLGDRRTPTIRGATSATAPFHWDGDQRDLAHLLGDVFAGRMGAGLLSAPQRSSLAHWIDGLPTLRTHAPADADTLARGRAVFEGPAACADCHSGAALTNNDTVDVGTGGSFQVPQLHGLAARAPYLHDGRAGTLDLRLMMNDGDRHGRTAKLTALQRADLLAYLSSL